MEENKSTNGKLSDPALIELKEKIEKGLELSFKKLVKTKRQNGGVFVFSENGVIKKVKAEDIDDYNSSAFFMQIPILYR